MSTCKELSELINQEKDAEAKARLEATLAAREKSHRDPLKSKEKSLRSKESTTLKELTDLLRHCEQELADDDSVLKRVRASASSKESHFIELWESKLTKKNLTSRLLEEISIGSNQDLEGAITPQAGELLKKIKKLAEARNQSHRSSLENELTELQTNSAPLKDLAKFRQKILLELSDKDPLISRLDGVIKKREASVKGDLTGRFKEIIKNLKKTKSSTIQSFLNECTQELDENDALISQVKSTLETKLLESQGMKPVHNLDEVERGEREKITDDLPTTRGKKAKADTPSKKKPKSSTSKDNESSTSLISGAIDVISGFRNDLAGAPPSSTLYKLGILFVFCLYLFIIFYSTTLTAKVTHYDVDLSGISKLIPVPQRSAPAVDVPAAVSATSATKKSSGGGASSSQAKSEATKATSSDSDDSGDSAGGSSKGGGDDDDD